MVGLLDLPFTVPPLAELLSTKEALYGYAISQGPSPTALFGRSVDLLPVPSTRTTTLLAPDLERRLVSPKIHQEARLQGPQIRLPTTRL